jgi:hypothetical protein
MSERPAAPPSRERDCGEIHTSIEDAIHHAKRNLGGDGLEPYWGTMSSSNVGWVVGFQFSSRRRWRLDFDPNPRKLVHVNEEDFDRAAGRQKVVHRVHAASFDEAGQPRGNDTQVRLYWKKWTSRFGKR